MVVLKSEINYESHAECCEPTHPFVSMTFDEITDHINKLTNEHKGFKNLQYVYNQRTYGYGARSAWYDLMGEEA